MAKGGKKTSKDAAAPRALLGVAAQAFEQGDVRTARRLAYEVLAGKAGPDEESAAKKLSKELSAEGHPVGEAPADVAHELLARSQVPVKAYLLAALAALIFVVLLTLATSRYH